MPSRRDPATRRIEGEGEVILLASAERDKSVPQRMPRRPGAAPALSRAFRACLAVLLSAALIAFAAPVLAAVGTAPGDGLPGIPGSPGTPGTPGSYRPSAGMLAPGAASRTAAARPSSETSRRLIISWQEGGASAPHSASEWGSRLREGAGLSVPREGAGLEELLSACPDLPDRLAAAPWIAPDTQVIEAPPGLEEEAALLLEGIGGVRRVEPDRIASIDATIDATIDTSSCDTYYARQWHLERIGADKAWSVSTGSPGVIIAVVDTGVDASHPDLAGRVLAGFDFVSGDGDASDDHGHGTQVAGIAAAAGDNGSGVAGVAWKVRILPVKVLDSSGCGYYSDIIAGIRYAADNGAAAINLSLSGGARSDALQEAVDYALSRGAVVVAAAGNDALDTLGYPAACRGVIAVGATDRDDIPAAFSNRGEGLDLVAPGISVFTTSRGGGFTAVSGTSASAPQVAGAAALLRSVNPGVDPGEVEERLRSTARDLGSPGPDSATGCGLLQAQLALGWNEPGASEAASTSLYFAEGYTGPGFDTYTLLENPGGEAARAVLRFYGPQGPSSSLDVEVPPRSRRTLLLDGLVPEGDVSCRLDLPEGSPLRAQRSMYFRYGGIGGGHTSRPLAPSSTWYFAEGYTGPGFDTWLLLFNPQEEEVGVELTLYAPDDELSLPLRLAPLSRRSVLLNELFPGREEAAAVHADLPVVAERAMYFDCGGRSGGSGSGGIAEPANRWFFAEGYTGPGFDTWLLLFNPSDREVETSLSFLRSDGVELKDRAVLAPHARRTVHLDDLPGLACAEVSTEVSAPDPGVVAERAMYFDYRGPDGLAADGGHAAPGCASPSDHALLPEGYTGPGFDTWVLVANLEDREVTVDVFLYGESGRLVRVSRTLAPRSRLSLRENDLLPGEGVSAEVSGPPGAALAVDGALYFHCADGIDDGSD
jgi:subtilisin family serine protease